MLDDTVCRAGSSHEVRAAARAPLAYESVYEVTMRNSMTPDMHMRKCEYECECVKPVML